MAKIVKRGHLVATRDRKKVFFLVEQRIASSAPDIWTMLEVSSARSARLVGMAKAGSLSAQRRDVHHRHHNGKPQCFAQVRLLNGDAWSYNLMLIPHSYFNKIWGIPEAEAKSGKEAAYGHINAAIRYRRDEKGHTFVVGPRPNVPAE